jgi:hypothetical protein
MGNAFLTLSSSRARARARAFSFTSICVGVNIIGINLVGLLLICIVIHGGMAIKVCASNCKIDFCQGGLLQQEKCMISNDQR